jgi:DNA-binding transcriptional LysR family regulator
MDIHVCVRRRAKRTTVHKIKLGQLEMLIAAVDAGSFSAAAIELGCTQSRISHAIAELEGCVGTRLLMRSRSGCIATDSGQQVLARARQMVGLADSLIDLGRQDSDVSGHVRIACFGSVGTHLLPYALEALARDYPGIRVDVDNGCINYQDVVDAVEQGTADLGITRAEDDSHLVQYRLAHDAYVCVVPASARLSAPLTWQKVADLPFIHAHTQGAQRILDLCRADGFKPRTSRKWATDSGVLAMVGRGMGFTISPQLATFPVPKNVKIMDLPFPAKRHIALIAQAETARSKACKIVTRLIRDKRILKMTEAFRANVIGLD